MARMFEATVERDGSAEALVQGERRLTYHDLAVEVHRLAHALRALGVKRGDRVALWLPNYPEWVVANLAIGLLRAVTVTVNTRLKPREVGYVLSTAKVSLVITTETFMTNKYCEILEELLGRNALRGSRITSAAFPDLQTILTLEGERPWTLDYRKLVAEQPSDLGPELTQLLHEGRPDDPLSIFWTSGTTANPKAALTTHEVLANIWDFAQILEYGREDRCLVPTPLFYTTANYFAMLVAIMTGACILPLLRFTSDEALRVMEEEKATIAMGMTNTFLTYLKDPDIERGTIKTLRAILVGGATVPRDLALELKRKLGATTFCQCYGMTETAGVTTMTMPSESLEDSDGSIGYALPGLELRYVDPTTGEEVPPGVEGELWVRSPMILKTYYGMSADDLRLYFTPDGWYRTGDVILRDERGRHYFRTRIKDIIKVAGENVAAREVEMVLYEHPSVHQVAVFGVPDPERLEAIAAVIEPAAPVTADELLQFCRARLASFKVPRFFLFRDAIPLTPSGKIAKATLKPSVLSEVESMRIAHESSDVTHC